MNLENFNSVVNAVNQRITLVKGNTNYYIGKPCILPALQNIHVTHSTLCSLQETFQALMGKFVLETPQMSTHTVSVAKYEDSVDPFMSTENIEKVLGQVPVGYFYIGKGNDSEAYDRPIGLAMQPTFPFAWMIPPKHTLLSDWDKILADINGGTSRLLYLPFTNYTCTQYTLEENGNSLDEDGLGPFRPGEGISSSESVIYPEYPIGCTSHTMLSCYSWYAPFSKASWNRVSNYTKIKMRNPYAYPILLRVITCKIPWGGSSYGDTIVTGCGTCNAAYTIPEPRIDVGTDGVARLNKYRMSDEFWDSVRYTGYDIEERLLQPGETWEVGFSEFEDYSTTEFVQKTEKAMMEHGAAWEGGDFMGGQSSAVIAMYTNPNWISSKE